MKFSSVFTITFEPKIVIAIMVAVSILASSCTNSVVFHPNQIRYHTPRESQINQRDIFLRSVDGIQIHGWLLPAEKEPKGTVFFLHGNAQNISAHTNTIYWLPKNGYHVFIMDYRGYGDSTGSPTLPGTIIDIETGYKWLINQPFIKQKPLFILGHSLGASLSICFVGLHPEVKEQLFGIIVLAGFSNLRTLVRQKLGGFWMTWPFQYPLSHLFTNDYDPEDFIQKISPVPLLIMHSDEDEVISSSHGRKLFELALPPKVYQKTQGGHGDYLKDEVSRQKLLEFMKNATDDKNGLGRHFKH